MRKLLQNGRCHVLRGAIRRFKHVPTTTPAENRHRARSTRSPSFRRANIGGAERHGTFYGRRRCRGGPGVVGRAIDARRGALRAETLPTSIISDTLRPLGPRPHRRNFPTRTYCAPIYHRILPPSTRHCPTAHTSRIKP